MGLREVALEAHEQAEAQRVLLENSAAAREAAEREEEEERRAHERDHLLAMANIDQWFPGETFDVIQDKCTKGAASGYGTGVVVAPFDRSVHLLLERAPGLRGECGVIQVSAVRLDRDRDTGYSYWTGSVVESAADVGAYIKAHEER